MSAFANPASPPRNDTIVVCGAGAAGMSAAIAAARAGQHVWLIEARPKTGGTVTHSLIHTLGGLYDSAGRIINEGLSGELILRLEAADPRASRRRIGRTWVFSVDPKAYEQTTREWITECREIHTVFSAAVSKVVVDRRQVKEITIAAAGESIVLCPSAVVDATGTADMVRLVDLQCVEDHPQAAAGGLIFTMRNVEPEALVYPKNLGLLRELWSAAAAGTLPAACGKMWIDSGASADEVYFKLFVPLGEGWRKRRGEITRDARNCQRAVLEFVKRMAPFAAATLGRSGELGIRDGGRILGDYLLSVDDVRAGAKFADGVCRCAWPIEYWDPESGVTLEYLPDDSHYEIPLRSLKLRGYDNVFAAGKCLSADRFAQASARVVGTCWAMGEAAGCAAAGQLEMATT